ncbi:hypothetical protein F0344_16035 [Streptomyces finlayi]|uniref:Uncharacterized protein n=1 Tax=Streptomyces finlayi TaxID=67296 RepID=A0A7G7BKT3_9ACTN|nr:hypothetical protein [Streptomyces finlayi]QNE75948.1 hypothetical protein F0344_16035 [Streptomyces finlayi]
MNMQEAAEYADKVLDETFVGIEPEVQWSHGPTTTGGCDVTRRRTVMTVISDGRRGSFLGVVDRLWRKGGYAIKAINSDREFPAIYAQTRRGFGVSLSIGGEGQAFFEVDSPCVEKSEVADSTSKPTGPAFEGEFIPRPNVHSDFWSAEVS